jgi:hypothetical protein
LAAIRYPTPGSVWRRREHGVPGTAGGLDLGLVAHHLDLRGASGRSAGDHDGPAAAGEVEVLDGARAAAGAGVDDRAPFLAGAPAVRPDRAEDVAAEAPHGLVGRDPEEGGRLRVQVLDAAVAVDREHPLDDAGEEGLGLRLSMPELGGQVAQALARRRGDGA